MSLLSFIITAETELPDPTRVIAAAHEMGIELSVSEDSLEESESEESSESPEEEEESPDILTFNLADGSFLMVCLMPMPHPDVAEMARGPLSPDDIDELINAPAHLIVTLVGEMVEENEPWDIKMAGLTAAVLAGCQPLGVLKMPGVLFHRPELFAESAKSGIANDELPLLICVDITAAQESETHLSLLTHNMQRYGREELYVTASVEEPGALEFVLDMMSWLISDRDYKLPTGETVGRTADEKIRIQRVPNPIGEGPEVIRLDMP